MVKSGAVAMGLMAVLALGVILLMAGTLLPVGINAIVSDSTTSLTLEEGEEEPFFKSVNATVVNVDHVEEEATLELEDTDTTDSQTETIGVGNSEVYSLQEDVTVTLDEIADAPDTASFTVEYPGSYGWGSGAIAIWENLDMIAILVVFLFLVGLIRWVM